MMARANRDTNLLIQNRGQIMGVNIAQGKGDNSSPLLKGSRSIDSQTGNLLQAFQSIGRNFMLMLNHPLHSQAVKIINSSSKTNRLSNRRGTGLKFPG